MYSITVFHITFIPELFYVQLHTAVRFVSSRNVLQIEFCHAKDEAAHMSVFGYNFITSLVVG